MFGFGKKITPEKVAIDENTTPYVEDGLSGLLLKLKNCSSEEKSTLLSSIGSRKLAKLAIEQMDDIEALKSLSRKGVSDHGVRSAAKHRLAELMGSSFDQETRSRRQLNDLAIEAEKRYLTANWLVGSEWFAKARAEKDALLSKISIVDDEIEIALGRFDESANLFDTRKKEYESQIAGRKEWEALCNELESALLMNEPQLEQCLAEIIHKKTLLPKISIRYEELLNKRYEMLKNRAENHLKEFLQDEEKRQNATQLLNELVEEIERIANAEKIPDEATLNRMKRRYNRAIEGVTGVDEAKKQFLSILETAEKRFETCRLQREAAQKIKYDTAEKLIVEIEKLENAEDALLKSIHPSVQDLVTQFGTLGIPREDPISQKFYRFESEHNRRYKLLLETEDQERWAHYAIKLKMCENLEQFQACLNESIQPTDVMNMIKQARQQWKNIGPIPKMVVEEMWTRFDNCCNVLYQWCHERFKEEDVIRENNLKIKLNLCESLEKLNADGLTDMKKCQIQFNQIIEQWKNTGFVPKTEFASLNDRFHSATQFFNRYRNDYYKEIHARKELSINRKKDLIASALRLVELEWSEGFRQVQNLRKQWKETGFSGKNQDDVLWNEFNHAIEAFFNKIDQQRPLNLEMKKQCCEQVETLLAEINEKTDWRLLENKIDHISHEWSKIGSVTEEFAESILTRWNEDLKKYKKALSEQHKKIDDIHENCGIRKRHLLEELEKLLQSANEIENITDSIKQMQMKWKEIGCAHKSIDQSLNQQFRSLCDLFFNNRHNSPAALALEWQKNLQKKQELCIQLEKLAGITAPSAEKESFDLAQLAMELQFALSDSVTQKVVNAPSDVFVQAKNIQEKWNQIGPVDKTEVDALTKRYKRACDEIFKKNHNHA